MLSDVLPAQSSGLALIPPSVTTPDPILAGIGAVSSPVVPVVIFEKRCTEFSSGP
uniref:Uncharacterized protein n=1 Tax=Helianthus annuus TaxID=4232 RepID=A0A251TEZ7_HELAN